MAAVEAGDAAPILEALKEDSSGGKRGDRRVRDLDAGSLPLVAGLGGSEGLRGVLGQFLLEESLQSRARTGRLQEALLGSVAALREAGVEVVALKGAALAFFHYADPSLRPMGDLDLLLREPRDLARATDGARVRRGWRPLFDTPRHRVFARPDERIARPATEDPDNPIRLEIHTSFRLPVLGRVYDASAQLRAEAEARDLDGARVAIAAGPALLTHLLFHAAEDFAGNGIRGIQAYDFRLLASAGAARSGSGDFFEWKGSGARRRSASRPTPSSGCFRTPSKNSFSRLSLERVARGPARAAPRRSPPPLHAPGAGLDANAPVARRRARCRAPGSSSARSFRRSAR